MKITRKFFAVTILVTLAMFLLTACSGETELVITDTSMEMTHREFTGTETHTVPLAAETTVTFDIITRTGGLDINISDKYGTVVATGTSVEGQMSFVMKEYSEYTIRVDGHSHRGSFRISWE